MKDQILSGEMPTEKQPSELSKEEVETLIDGLPIACLDKQYSVRCSSDDLTKAGPALFQKIHLNEDELGLIEADLLNVDRTQEGIVEKDPTVYLFRRNLGTHLFLLGLVPWEIQYVLGHDIEDPGEFRSFFRNEEKLYPIWQKMSKRPIVNDLPETITEYENGFRHKEDTYKEKIKVAVSSDRHIRLELSQHEPLDKTTVMIRCSDAHVEGEVIQEPNPESFRATVNIGRLIDKTYRRAKKPVCDDETEVEPDNLG